LTEQQIKVRAFKADQNKKLVKAGHRPLISASEIYIPPCQTSGILSLDVALGGGWANNRWIEVVGEASSSKTTSILHTIATNQALNEDYSVYWLASEPYNPDWAALNGIDNDRVVVDETNNMELGMQNVIDAARSNNFDCIVIDSYPALIADAEADKDMDGFSMSAGARRVGQFFRKITDSFSDERPYVGFFVNQFRDNIGGYSPVGTPKTEPGGKAKNYNFYQRVKVQRDDWIEETKEGMGKVKVGQTTKYQITKNKQGAPQRVAVADMYFDFSAKGFKPGQYDRVKDIITMAVMFKVVKRAGAWFSFISLDGTEFKWQGRDPMVEEIRGNLVLQEEINKLTLDIATNKD
jgi:recombination protein RecA